MGADLQTSWKWKGEGMRTTLSGFKEVFNGLQEPLVLVGPSLRDKVFVHEHYALGPSFSQEEFRFTKSVDCRRHGPQTPS